MTKHARVAAAAPNQAAADAAVEVAACGGGAVDGAIAAMLVTLVNEPGVVSLGAGAFLTVGAPGEVPITIDGNVEMPGREVDRAGFGAGVREVTTSYGGGVTMTIGHGSVATPGALAAFAEAHRRYGRVPWREVMGPAIRIARRGFPLGEAGASYLALVHDSVFGWQPESSGAVHRPDGVTPLATGETVRIAHLADALQRLADVGPADFYTGELAGALVDDMRANDGLIGHRDLAEYEPRVSPALPVSVGDWSLATNPPPSIGGPVLAALLLLTDRPPVDGPDSARRMVEVQLAVLRHRARHLDLAEDRLQAAQAMLDSIVREGSAWVRTSPSTAHVSVVGDDGFACALTASAGYGSGVMVPGTGIWMNNSLGEPELNRRGLHAWEPGTRLPSNMALTVGRGRGAAEGAALAIGSPGADRITTAIAQVLLGMGQGLDLSDAVASPRLHVALSGRGEARVEYEEGLRLPELPVPAREWPGRSMFFGGVGVALREPGGHLRTAADPRRGGGTAVGPAA
ncbi:MAG: gamma-glutamyltransferase [Actinomycetes bacterium]